MPSCSHFRFLIAGLIFTSTMSLFIGRMNISTAIVEMINSSTTPYRPNQSAVVPADVCPLVDDVLFQNSSSAKELHRHQRFNWDERTQGLILGAFFWGYFLLQIPGGRMVEHFGPRIMISVGIFGTGVVNLVTPALAPYTIALIASRVLLGVAQAAVFSAAFSLATHWFPEGERTAVISLTCAGTAFGTVLTATLTAWLCAWDGFAGGWPSSFYASGFICITTSGLICLVVRNSPQEHPWISEAEADYIGKNISKNCAISPPFPWFRVLTSRAIFAQICVKFTHMWTFNLAVLKLPSYMKKVLRMPIQKNGNFTSAVFVANALSHFLTGLLADYAIRRKVFRSKTILRKIFQSIAVFGTSAALACIPTVGCDRVLFLLVLVLSQSFFGFEAGGELPLPADLSPTYTATLFSIANMISMTTGFIGPYLTGVILDADPEHPFQQWSIVIYGMASLNCIGGLVFLIFGTAERQNWDAVEASRVKPEMETCEMKIKK